MKRIRISLRPAGIWMGAFLLAEALAFPAISPSQPLAQGQNKFVGNIISTGLAIRPDFATYWNQVTAENAGKWGSVESAPGVYNWTGLDNIYNYAVSHGFPYKHHNLIWGSQQPGFMTGLDSASQYQEIENWFINCGSRYPQAKFWDVVNEPLHAPPSYKNALGGDGVTGWDWVIKAFRLARLWLAAGAKLHLNEYSVINDNAANANFLQIINLLKTRGLIDGIGVQGHHFEIDGGASTSTMQNNLNNLAATGLPIYITELDINQQSDSVQLQRYQTFFPVLYGHPGVYGITLWGYAQNEVWRPYTHLVLTGGAERPALKWLRKYLATPLQPLLVSPVGTVGEPRNAVLRWRPSALAASYRIQVSTNTIFTAVLVDSAVADTILRLNPLAANSTFYWRASASNDSGVSPYSVTGSFGTGNQIVGVEAAGGLPGEFRLSQNYPNPFNPATQIGYAVPERSRVSLRVYDVLGKEVATLFDGVRPAGEYVAEFNGKGLSSGIYFYRLVSGRFVETKKLVLMK